MPKAERAAGGWPLRVSGPNGYGWIVLCTVVAVAVHKFGSLAPLGWFLATAAIGWVVVRVVNAVPSRVP